MIRVLKLRAAELRGRAFNKYTSELRVKIAKYCTHVHELIVYLGLYSKDREW